jgi:hypothetical protein
MKNFQPKKHHLKARGDRKYKKDLLKNGLIWLIMLTILVAEYFILEEKE